MKYRGRPKKQRGGDMYQKSLIERMRTGIQASNDPRLGNFDPGEQMGQDPYIRFSPFANNAQGVPMDEALPSETAPGAVSNSNDPTGKKGNPSLFKWGTKPDALAAYNTIQAGTAWLAGMKDRGRQDQYMYDQYSTLGQRSPANTEDYQPNPYNLYSRYGGKMQMGGRRLVQQVPQGYAPIAGMPDHYQRQATVGLPQAQASSTKTPNANYAQKMKQYLSQGVPVDELVKKGYGTREGLNQYQSSYRPMSDTVYTQRQAPQMMPQQAPVAAFDGQLVYDGADHATGMYRFNTRQGAAPTAAITNSTGDWSDVEWSDVDQYGKPKGDIVPLSGELFNRALRGTNKLYDRSIIDSVRSATQMVKKKYGGKVKNKYRGA